MCIEVDFFDLEEMNNGNQPIEKLDEPKSQLTVFDIRFIQLRRSQVNVIAIVII